MNSAAARSVLRECAFLLLLAVAPALLSGWLHPKRPVWALSPPAIAQVELAVAQRWDSILWVDARSASTYTEAHIPGAVLLNETEWERLLPDFLAAWRPGQRIVVYCNTEQCDSSREVALRLQREFGITEVFTLKGGWTAWRQTQP